MTMKQNLVFLPVHIWAGVMAGMMYSMLSGQNLNSGILWVFLLAGLFLSSYFLRFLIRRYPSVKLSYLWFGLPVGYFIIGILPFSIAVFLS